MSSNFLARVSPALLAALLCSCGGGGGGSGSSSSSSSSGGVTGNPVFNANRTTLAFDYYEGGAGPMPTPQDIVLTVSGNYTGTVYLGTVVTGQGIAGDVPLTVISDTQGSFRVTPTLNLPLGTYSGTLQLQACSNSTCTRQVGNSPITISYITTVHTGLHVSNETINLTAVSGNAATQDLTVTLPWQVGGYSVPLGYADWLTVETPNDTTLRLTARSLPVGTRQTNLVVNSGFFNRPITVNYTATPPTGGEHDLDSNPTSVALTAVEGATSAPVMLNVRAPTWDPQATIGATITSSNGGVLSLNAVSGGYQVSADAYQTNPGTYNGEITLTVPPPGHPYVVPVTLTVGAGLATPANVDLTVDSNTTTVAANWTGSIPVNVVTGGPINWTATHPFEQWLVLTKSAGVSGESLTYAIDYTKLDLEYQPHGEFWTDVTIRPENPRMRPVTFRISVHKRLAQVFVSSPWYKIVGTQSRHIIRGRNFIANRDWSQKLRISGEPAGSRVTRVNDTKMIVDLEPSLNYVYFEVTNEIVGAPAADPVRMVPVRTNSYTVIPTGYPVREMHYNPETETVYALEDDTDNPRLFNYNKSPSPPFAWQSWGSINIAGARDISEPTDGRGLYTAGTNGFMAVSWPNTSGFFMPPGGMYIAPYGSNLIQTNDLRIWFSTGQQGLAYIDFPLGNIVTVADRLSGPSEGPWFEKSGDGDRLIISMAQSGQQYPALLMNMTDYVLQQAPAVEIDNSLIGGTVSDDGSRSITYWGRVRDAAFLPIGVTEPEVNNWVAVASTISRDGRRAYTFAFDFADFNRTQTISQPRIYVFDITTPVAADARFPKLGYFTLPDYPKCFGESLDCRGALQIKISPDNQTLFVAGSQNLIIAPIPAENLLTPASPPAGKQARPKGATQPWHVDTTKH